jgi:uncharacterized protein
MLLKELPKQFDPFKLCKESPKEGLAWHGHVFLKALHELCDILRNQPDAKVDIDLVFKMDEQNQCYIEGEISSKINLICQRCLESMPYEIKSSFVVSPIEEESQANMLPAAYEPLLASGGEVSLDKWIAEELHLALPLAPSHEPSCKPRHQEATSQEDKPENPFAKLAKIKHDN